MNHTWNMSPNAKNILFVVDKDTAIFLYYFYHNLSDATPIIQTSEILFLTNIKIIKVFRSFPQPKMNFYDISGRTN